MRAHKANIQHAATKITNMPYWEHARVGSTGQSTGNHLHIAFIKDSTYYNPADFLPADMLNKINTRGLNLHSLASYTP